MPHNMQGYVRTFALGTRPASCRQILKWAIEKNTGSGMRTPVLQGFQRLELGVN